MEVFSSPNWNIFLPLELHSLASIKWKIFSPFPLLLGRESRRFLSTVDTFLADGRRQMLGAHTIQHWCNSIRSKKADYRYLVDLCWAEFLALGLTSAFLSVERETDRVSAACTGSAPLPCCRVSARQGPLPARRRVESVGGSGLDRPQCFDCRKLERSAPKQTSRVTEYQNIYTETAIICDPH